MNDQAAGQYYLFGSDRQVYGPATLELLRQWSSEGCLSEASWIYDDRRDAWCQAKSMPELQGATTPATALEATSASDLRPGQLRRIAVFADMSDSQLERFLGLLEKVKLGPFRPVVRKGEHGDAMFLVLGGEARVVDKIDGKDQTLQTLEVGNFFGEISLFDQGPRTADVVTNKDSTFLKISKAALQRLLAEQPDVAAAFLMALVRLMGGRLRAANKSFAESLTFKNAEGQIRSPSSSSSPNWGGRK